MTIPLLNFGSIKVLLEAIKSASAKALISLILEGKRIQRQTYLFSIIFLILE
jgi:hypothetical protein